MNFSAWSRLDFCHGRKMARILRIVGRVSRYHPKRCISVVWQEILPRETLVFIDTWWLKMLAIVTMHAAEIGDCWFTSRHLEPRMSGPSSNATYKPKILPAASPLISLQQSLLSCTFPSPVPITHHHPYSSSSPSPILHININTKVFIFNMLCPNSLTTWPFPDPLINTKAFIIRNTSYWTLLVDSLNSKSPSGFQPLLLVSSHPSSYLSLHLRDKNALSSLHQDIYNRANFLAISFVIPIQNPVMYAGGARSGLFRASIGALSSATSWRGLNPPQELVVAMSMCVRNWYNSCLW